MINDYYFLQTNELEKEKAHKPKGGINYAIMNGNLQSFLLPVF